MNEVINSAWVWVPVAVFLGFVGYRMYKANRKPKSKGSGSRGGNFDSNEK